MQLKYFCESCGKPFRGWPRNANRFCSPACYNRRVPKKPLAVRFWAKVDKDGPTPPHRPELGPCWIWTACKGQKGYGRIGLGSHEAGTTNAHRVAWLLATGSLPLVHEICHKCDNPSCVRIDHLFEDTHAGNMADARAKGIVRADWMGKNPVRGEKHPAARLTQEQVTEIRKRWHAGEISQAALAREYGRSPRTISDLILKKRWKHVP